MIGRYAERMYRHDLLALALITSAGVVVSLGVGAVVAISLILASLGLALARPRAAVAAIPVAIPFVHNPVAIGNSLWMLLEIAIVIASIAIALHLALGVARQRSFAIMRPLVEPYPVTLIVLTLFLLSLFSLTTVVDQTLLPDSLRELRWVIVEPIAVYFAVRWLHQDERGRSLMLIALLGAAVVVAGMGLVQLATGRGIVIADGVERATGPYSHPNNLALYLERVAILALGVTVATRNRSRLIASAALICGLGMAATLSRGAILAYLAGAIWVIGAAKIKGGWRAIAAGSAIAFVIIAAIAGSRLVDTGAEGSRSSRELIWSASIDMIQDHPITGVGLDQFYGQYGRRYVEPAGWPERYTSHPHNMLFDVWLRLGIAGVAVFGGLAVIIARNARLPRSGEWERAMWTGATGALIAGLVHGLIDNSYFLPDLAVMTWLLVALLVSTTAYGTRMAGPNE
jgi:putative inorganic carbon (hco3(-)) transporter